MEKKFINATMERKRAMSLREALNRKRAAKAARADIQPVVSPQCNAHPLPKRSLRRSKADSSKRLQRMRKTDKASHPKPDAALVERASIAVLFRDITYRFIAQLKAGCAPWVQPWTSKPGNIGFGMPVRFVKGNAKRAAIKVEPHTGINVLILWAAAQDRGYTHHAWLTLKQAKAFGGRVRNDERGTWVLRYESWRRADAVEEGIGRSEIDDFKMYPKFYEVFNISQYEGLPTEFFVQAPPVDQSLIDPKVRQLIKKSGINFNIEGKQAFYSIDTDSVYVPSPELFFESVNWHAIVLHECAHATGAPHRCKRDLTGEFGSKNYAFEELVAEITAAFCCAALGIRTTVRHENYIANWIDLLESDPRAIFRAAAKASTAAKWLLKFAPTDGELTTRTTMVPPKILRPIHAVTNRFRHVVKFPVAPVRSMMPPIEHSRRTRRA